MINIKNYEREWRRLGKVISQLEPGRQQELYQMVREVVRRSLQAELDRMSECRERWGNDSGEGEH